MNDFKRLANYRIDLAGATFKEADSARRSSGRYAYTRRGHRTRLGNEEGLEAS